jgi:hypothetical protein
MKTLLLIFFISINVFASVTVHSITTVYNGSDYTGLQPDGFCSDTSNNSYSESLFSPSNQMYVTGRYTGKFVGGSNFVVTKYVNQTIYTHENCYSSPYNDVEGVSFYTTTGNKSVNTISLYVECRQNYFENQACPVGTQLNDETCNCEEIPECESSPPPAKDSLLHFSSAETGYADCVALENLGTYTKDGINYTQLECWSDICQLPRYYDLYGTEYVNNTTCQPNATYNSQTSSCACNDGYYDPSGTSNECVPTNCGQNMTFNGSSCVCNDGYSLNDVFDSSAGCSPDNSSCISCDDLSIQAMQSCLAPNLLSFECSEVNGCGTISNQSCTPPDDNNSTTPPDDNNSTTPPDDNNSTTPPDDTPPDDNNSTTPPDDNSNLDAMKSSLSDISNKTDSLISNTDAMKSSLSDISNKTDSLISNTDAMKSSLSTISSDLKSANNRLSSIDSSINSLENKVSSGLFSDSDPFANVEFTDGSEKFGEFENTLSSGFNVLEFTDIFGFNSIPSSSLPTYQVTLFSRTITFFEPSMMDGLPLDEIRGLLMFFAALIGFITVFRTI